MPVEIQHQVTAPEIPIDQTLQDWAQILLKDQQQVLIRIVDKQESQQLNFQYRQQDKATNVLSFPDDLPIEINPFIGDLVICAEIVKEQAENQSKSIAAHWAHMIIHGILHLQGFDHQNNHEAKIMEAQEIKTLKKLNFANPYEL